MGSGRKQACMGQQSSPFAPAQTHKFESAWFNAGNPIEVGQAFIYERKIGYQKLV